MYCNFLNCRELLYNYSEHACQVVFKPITTIKGCGGTWNHLLCHSSPPPHPSSLYLSLLLVCLAAFSGPALVGGLEEGPVPDSLPISRKVILLNIQVTFPFLAGKNKTVLVLLNITVYNLSALTEIIYILQQFYVQKLC